ncbi:hypothetical protein ACIRU3_12935 [Streptomyces sp. NPDC101151]|uniref:hypothetical protein n=1 Tax=Streptomyces sp. NPDC101151 TaxID=3366115 RepID=UPI00381412E7
MSERLEPVEYWAEVRADGPVYGTGETVPYMLGSFQTISPVLVLRWLRGQALRVADLLDPTPERSAWVQPSMRVTTVVAPDGPALLRAWAADRKRERDEREHIKDGYPLAVVLSDADCTYTLSVWPAHQPAVLQVALPHYRMDYPVRS